MANPHHHAVSSARRFGGEARDYYAIHHWFDESKEMHSDIRHRVLRHHTQGIFEAERIFGGETGTITNAEGRKIPVRWIAEQHVQEDFGGYIPSLSDWCNAITGAPWMNRPVKLSRELEKTT